MPPNSPDTTTNIPKPPVIQKIEAAYSALARWSQAEEQRKQDRKETPIPKDPGAQLGEALYDLETAAQANCDKHYTGLGYSKISVPMDKMIADILPHSSLVTNKEPDPRFVATAIGIAMGNMGERRSWPTVTKICSAFPEIFHYKPLLVELTDSLGQEISGQGVKAILGKGELLNLLLTPQSPLGAAERANSKPMHL